MSAGKHTVLFYRHFKRLRGGHLKVWDYFNHVRAAEGYEPRVAFTPKSRWNEANPWARARELVVEDAATVVPDAFFLAGRDWDYAAEHPRFSPDVPVLNLVQHVRHADPSSSRYEYLARRAIRICVSEAVAEAIRATGRTRGPVVVIPNCVDLDALPSPGDRERDIDLLIAALKHPELGRELHEALQGPGRKVVLLNRLVPRAEYLSTVARARATVFLPNETEGFYLPTLEGMAIGTLVICPEHEGEHGLYEAGRNSFRSPSFAVEELAEAAEGALALEPAAAAEMRAHARRTAKGRSLAVERRAFQDLLGRADELWADR